MGLKFLVSMNGVRAMYQTTTSLQMATPGHHSVDEIATYAFNPPLGHGHGGMIDHVGHRLPSLFHGHAVLGRAGLCTVGHRSCC